MNCPICKTGKMAPGFATVVLTRGDSTVVIKEVPATVCDDCGEYYLDEEATRIVYARSEELVAAGTDVSVLRFQVA